MNLTKKNPIEFKQPQELYCSNIECFNEVGILHEMNYIFTDEAKMIAEAYCFYCTLDKITGVDL